ncbi:hypothetical protein SGUI_1005 [Serinicoccus hydrothermalis]|uniref:Uncharacterized protein n=1 Tax=Serinicoccus hydrothermalis TaxID=1758689 RepID=A0A1B1NAG8_9MICO|nr:hypothetical protein [Serinicoccus hydrothermalis]ANS78401.1 hypothetical protein SGUI_1005 [Serinicoccus hydrothermalis]
MATVRCYLPLSAQSLALLRDERRLPGPLRATAVTDDARATDTAADQDELEYAAAQVAASSLADDGAPVVVAAADAQDRDVRADQGWWVQVDGVELARVASLHLGDDVVSGDPGALAAAGGADLELSWFDTTELDHVLDLTERLARTETTG